MRLLGNRPGSWTAVLAVLALFVSVGYWAYRNSPGDDLASSYVGSRLLIEGQGSHLFHYDPVSFAEIGEDDTWMVVAKHGDFAGFLHPYVQTPLWAYLLKPLCRHVRFPVFSRIFVVLTMLAFAGTLWLTARYWARSFFNPYAIGLVVVALALSQPFQYAMFLNQTHMLMFVLTVAALLLAEHDSPVSAGLLLAFAAAVKVTPALLILYWVITRRWKAAFSTVVWSGLLWLWTVAAVGHALTDAYLVNLNRISRVLLLSQNNQSFAAWVMAHFYPYDEAFDINIFPLPAALRVTSSALLLLCTALGGWFDWRRRQLAPASATAPLGALLATLAATVFAPIAWTHYSIVLVVPLMVLIDANREIRAWWISVLIAAALLLNYHPFASDVINGLVPPLALLRGQFFSCVLTMTALALAALWQIRSPARARSAVLAEVAV